MSDTQKNTLNFKEMKFLNVPLALFLVMAVLLWVGMGFNLLPTTSLALFAFLISVALPLTWIGKNTPFLGKYIGFGALLTIFAPSLLVNIGYITPDTQAAIKDLTNNVLAPLNIGLLMCGSMLGRLDRTVLIKAIIRYLPVILLSMIATIGLTALVGSLLGYTFFDSVVITAFPCFSGGSGGPVVTIPAVLTEAGLEGSKFVGLLMAALTLSNVEAIIFSGLLDTVGKARPKWTGNGNLVRSGGEFNANVTHDKFDGNIASLQAGVLVAAMLFGVSGIISVVMKPIVNLNYVVWLILLCLILKVSHLIPKYIENSLAWASDLMIGLVLPALMVGLGIGTIDLVSVANSITPQFFILVTVVVVGYIVFSMLFGRLFGLYPVEAGISVGCCSCNIGGTGDLICCQISKRLDLYPFASISTRIGGAIAIIALGIVLPYLV